MLSIFRLVSRSKNLPPESSVCRGAAYEQLGPSVPDIADIREPGVSRLHRRQLFSSRGGRPKSGDCSPERLCGVRGVRVSACSAHSTTKEDPALSSLLSSP